MRTFVCSCAALATVSGVVLASTMLGGTDSATPRSLAVAQTRDWSEILGPAESHWPDPQAGVVWREDLPVALGEARACGRPVLVTARCLPCKQCATFDQQVLDGSVTLTPLLARFITVRLTDAHALDLALLRVEAFQDLDNSWWAYFLSPRGDIYAIFGGRDETSDVSRISAAALEQTARRVLDHHYDERRLHWNLDWAAASGAEPVVAAARELPGFSSWQRRFPRAAGQDCLHCHQLAEVLRQPALDAGTFAKRGDADVWPYPENVGITLDRDDGLLVTAVAANSPAEIAGLRVGDSVRVAEGRLLFGQADLRGVLHREANPEGEIALLWSRADEIHSGTLQLTPGWRTTNLDWRMSISQGNIGPAPGFPFPLAGPRDTVPTGSMSVRPFFGRDARNSVAHRAGLREHHVIVAVNGESPDLVGRAFLVWFRLNHQVGDEVTLTVLENGEQREIQYTLPPQ